ncbi:MAG: NAD(P)-binding domain-containing protein [Erysipelotrichaceae bacterium]|jgi:pyrroline-5-carboxylate reductase|nr:NAD(P)-binding domain-containing protein [Erysipelotrichaceae bacterium]
MKIGILGFGHLGEALAKGLIKAGIAHHDLKVCTARDASWLAAESYQLELFEEADDLIREVDLLVLAIKGKVFDTLLFDTDLTKELVVLSFMAGVSLEHIRAKLDPSDLVVAIPTIAMESCHSLIAHTPTDNKMVLYVLNQVGQGYPMPLNKMAAFTSFVSCGLGFAGYLLDAFQQGGQALGFPSELAYTLTRDTFAGLLELGSFANTAERVATKGGVTQQGIELMVGEGVQDAMKKAFLLAKEKAEFK